MTTDARHTPEPWHVQINPLHEPRTESATPEEIREIFSDWCLLVGPSGEHIAYFPRWILEREPEHRYVECVEEEFARFTGDSTFGRAMRSKGFDDIANMLKEKKEVHEQGPIAKERRHIAGRFISLAGEMEESGCHAREIVERLKKLADQLTQEPSDEAARKLK